jgi:hypothetical protein
MKKLFLPILGLAFLLCGTMKSFSWPVYDPFDYTTGQTVWGQYDTNTQDYWMEIDSAASAANAIIIANQAVTYPGLPASPGYSFLLTNVNGAQGPRMFITSNSLNWPGNGGGFIPNNIEVLTSLIIDVTNMGALYTNAGNQFMIGYNDQGSVSPQGGNPGTIVDRIYFKAVQDGTGTNYIVGISKQGEGPYYATNILGVNQQHLIVMDSVITNDPVGEAGNPTTDLLLLWVDPPASSFGAATEPTPSVTENPGLGGNLTPYTSCIIFENRSTVTPVTLIGQFRYGTNWSWITGGPCISNNQPGSVYFYIPSPISLTATPFYNGSPNTYQWCFNGVNLTNGPSITGSGATVGGAQTTNLSLVNTTTADSGNYTVIISNAVGAFTSVVSTVSVQSPVAPSVTAQPSPATIPLYHGGSTHVSFTAAGSTPIFYYWYSNTTVVGVTTNVASFLYSNVQATASVYCLVSNPIGTIYTQTNTIQLLPQPTAPYPLAVINDKPMAFWPLSEHPDNSSGNNGALAFDFVGGNDGVYSNTIIAQPSYGPGLATQYGYPTPSDTNTAAEFGYYPTEGSTNSYVGDIPNIDFTAAADSPSFSVEAWVNAEGNSEGTSGSADPAGIIVAKGWGNANSGSDEFGLEYSGGNTGGGVGWSFYVRDQSGIAFFATKNTGIDANWHHLVGVFAEPTPTLMVPVLSLYMDGVLLTSNTGYAASQGTNTIGVYNSTFPLTIGSAGSTLANATNAPDKNWFGDIADVAIYKYALTANQVSNHYWSAGLPPTIEVQPPGSVDVSDGGSVSVSVSVAGTAPLSYQWIDGNTSNPIPGQTNATLVVSNITANDSYALQVTSPYGSATSASTSVSVKFAPEIEQDIAPSTPTVVVGNSVSFVVGVDGASPITYWWQFNSQTISANPRFTGIASNVLTISNVQLGDAGTYQLFASNSYGGPVSSSQATLTVTPWLGLSGGNTWGTESSNPNPYPQNNELDLTTTAASQDTASFYQDPVYIQAFQAFFTYQVLTGPNNSADGATFCVQNDPRGSAAEGESGSGLGYGATAPANPVGTSPITHSVALEFNIYAGNGIGGVGIALGTNGSVTNVTLTGQVVLNSGDAINVVLEYLAGVLTVNLTDSTAGTQFTMKTNVNIPAVVGTNVAYVGFTGSTGGSGSFQTITDFSFQSMPALTIQPSGNNAVLSWPADVGSFVLQETSNLASTNWAAATNVSVTVGNQNQVTVSPTGAPQFFRLYQSQSQ